MDDTAARLAALEKAVEAIQRELTELKGPRAPVARPEPAVVEALPEPAARNPRPAFDLELLVGRYGMLALATVLALAAAGTFVGWAIRHGLLGPIPRVILGLVAAAAIGAFGVRLRAKEKSFGDSLLGLALAITHVCAWAAGPGLHIVPPFVALALSAVASVALAGYALVQDDELLWCVGFGGAAIAPFVTSTGQGTAPMLAAYAAAVLIAGGSALGSRGWTIAARVFGAASLLFTGALMALPRSQHSAELALALPFAVAGLGVLPFAKGAAIRPRLRTLGILAAVAALNAESLIGGALAAAAWLVLVELVDSEPAGLLFDGLGDAGPAVADWVDGFVIPAGLLGALWSPLQSHAIYGFVAAVLVFWTSRREGALRDGAALTAFLAAIVAASAQAGSSLEWQAAAVCAVAVVFAFLERVVPNRTWQWAPMLALVLAGLTSLAAVTRRPAYEYVPFGTRQSAAAFVVALGWFAIARLFRTSTARWIALAYGFLWINQELAFAASPSTSTLLLVTWYAATGVGCVGFGRARAAPRLRHVGLGLGIIAAALAFKAAWGLPSTAARIGAYLVVSVFLLGIAWWYRRPGPAPQPDPGTPT